MVEVIDLRYIEEYKLDLTFSNNVSKIVDLQGKNTLGKRSNVWTVKRYRVL